MTRRQIVHALKIVDDIHRIRNPDVPPGGIVLLRTSIEDVVKAQARIEKAKPA